MNQYTASNGVSVESYDSGDLHYSTPGDEGYGDSLESEVVVALREFFHTAHPERKPWEDAKPGEVWEITFSEEGGGGPDAWIVHRSMTFRNPEFVSKVPLNDTEIKTARRIWPEGNENA